MLKENLAIYLYSRLFLEINPLSVQFAQLFHQFCKQKGRETPTFVSWKLIDQAFPIAYSFLKKADEPRQSLSPTPFPKFYRPSFFTKNRVKMRFIRKE